VALCRVDKIQERFAGAPVTKTLYLYSFISVALSLLF